MLKAICTAFDLPQYERVQKWLNSRKSAKVPEWVLGKQQKANILIFK
jgi:aminoglycoside phosphotransferase (APT) family kinase protein